LTVPLLSLFPIKLICCINFILSYREKEKRGVGGFLCSWKVVSIVLTLFTLLLASTIIYLGGEQLHRELYFVSIFGSGLEFGLKTRTTFFVALFLGVLYPVVIQMLKYYL
jgi:hypothetical protein